MTEDEREQLVAEMSDAYFSAPCHDGANPMSAALAVAEATIRADEREECAKEAEQHGSSGGEGDPYAEGSVYGYTCAVEQIAAAIRARPLVS